MRERDSNSGFKFLDVNIPLDQACLKVVGLLANLREGCIPGSAFYKSITTTSTPCTFFILPGANPYSIDYMTFSNEDNRLVLEAIRDQKGTSFTYSGEVSLNNKGILSIPQVQHSWQRINSEGNLVVYKELLSGGIKDWMLKILLYDSLSHFVFLNDTKQL